MTMKFSSAILSAVLVAAPVGAQLPDPGTSLTFTGFLTDMLCARLEIAPDGANMLLEPVEHTVRCELLPACLRSGYGMAFNVGTDGEPLYRAGAVFDEPGNDFLVDILNAKDTTTNDLRVRIKGTFLETAPAAETPAIESRDGERSWPAMNNVPLITIDDLQFCNYEGPDANFSAEAVCSTESVLDLLASGDRNALANANLCMREEISLTSDQDNIVIGHSGCADHATFQDVKRADAVTCSQEANLDCDTVCEETDTCAAECTDACGNPIELASGAVAKACCLDACGNPIVDPCGFPFLDACGNPTLADGTICPAAMIAENQVNDCLDVCGNPVVDACGNPVDACCLDACGSPILDPCGFPWLDACGNPAMDAAGSTCANLGANVCLPSEDTCVRCEAGGDTCASECVDACGNPLAVDISGRPTKACCLDACGNPLVDPCGFPYLDPCGNPTLADGVTLCPAASIAENQANDCLDSCGNPVTDVCGNPVDACCLDACGNPLLDPCGFPWLDPCGNPAMDALGSACANLGANVCLPTEDETCDLICGEEDTCASECVDACGNPLAVDISGRPTKACCLDACGNPLVDPCGFPYLDPCGNPTLADGVTLCPAASIAENQANDCLDSCGNPVTDVCGNPVDACCLDACGNPLLDPCGFPWLDPCGNPAMDGTGALCQNLGENVCLPTTECHAGGGGGGGQCALECIDACGNPLPIDISGRPASSCCLDVCGNPILDPCGFPFYDPCGNPTTADGMVCSNIAENEINECVDACGNPITDTCGSPVDSCCVDVCGNPIVDGCGFAVLDPCGNPLTGINGELCPAGQLADNDCAGGAGAAPAWRKRKLAGATQGTPTTTRRRRAVETTRTKGIRKSMIANHNKIQEAKNLLKSQGRRLDGHDGCHAECVDACGNPLPVDISGRPAKLCCLDACGNPLLDGCGFPFKDACGNPTTGYSGMACPADQIGESDYNECIDSCGNPIADACGNPVDACCLDACGNPQLDPCGFPFLDACGNPADSTGATCTAANTGENACLEDLSGGGDCEAGCVDACGNPLPVDVSGRPTKACCLDPCGNPLVDPCGFPYLDACGNPTMADGSSCPAASVANNDINECIDGCGSPVVDACGNPVDSCCLDACGNPILDPCGFPWLDACGNPAMDGNGGVCQNLGENVCLGGGDDDGDTCSPASLFPPATESFQCEGLVSPCTVAMDGATDFTDGIPSNIGIGRRRMAATKAKRKMQSVSSVPLYTPVKKDLRFKIPSNPTSMRSRKELDPANDGVIGVAINGVPIVYEHPGEGANTLLFDSCGGHGDLANRYHYHLPPVCLLRTLGGTVPRVSDWWLAPSAETQWPSKAKSSGEKSPLVGWAIDGNPIFGPYNPDNGELVVPAGASGSEECSANTLDECNGMTLENGVYAYFITPTAPFVPPCLMGEVPADAFVDGGVMGDVDMCPFEGTDPLAGTEICDEKPIIFSDETCPGDFDRMSIRNCFQRAADSFVGEPTCSQMETAIAESAQCFMDAGCCHDLQATVAEWIVAYPALADCVLLEPECVEFASNNIIDLVIELIAPVGDLVPDTRALLRSTMASQLGVDPSQVSISRVQGSEESTTVFFEVAYPTEEEAAAAADALDIDAVTAGVQSGTGFQVSALEADHNVPPVPPPAPELWTTRRKAGLGSSLAAVVVLLGILVLLEDKPHGEPEPESAVSPKEGGV